MEQQAIARADLNGRIQPLEEHLRNTAEFCREFLAPCGFGDIGRLLGLLHDLGKYSPRFQQYIRSVSGLLKDGDPGFLPNAEKMRGKIPHAETGAWYWRSVRHGAKPQDLRTLLEMPVLYHHAFLADVYAPDGSAPYLEKKSAEGLDSPELFGRFAPEIKNEIADLIERKVDSLEIGQFIRTGTPDNFELGLLLRLLYSALIDADRTDAAGRRPGNFAEWRPLTAKLEKHLEAFAADTELNRIRQDISETARDAAGRPRGIYRFTIPTGGGKTLAGLRFALHHAAGHGMKRIIYAAPFLSILEQNAEVFRKFLDDAEGKVVLECHSNVLQEPSDGETPHDALAETWDAPIICTTMVQILNAMFSGESRFARRFHQFADAVVLLDEIQSLPLEMFHIFNRTVNFLAERMHATVILCSATQPELANVDPEKGSLHFADAPELYPNYPELFRKLRRVDAEYVPGLTDNERIAAFVGEKIAAAESLLLVCNTKRHAAEMFRLLRELHPDVRVFHLSTNLCAEHRHAVLKEIRAALRSHIRLIVVSTSLIEAGVDISFAAVIRMMTALDSIVQAAGRCNRNAEAATGHLYVLDDPQGEKAPSYVRQWSFSTGKALRDYAAAPEKFDSDMLSPELLKIYYTDLYACWKDVMEYPVRLEECKDESLLNLLGGNVHSYLARRQRLGQPPEKQPPRIRGAFRTAGEKFKALDELANTAVIVPYGDGKDIIAAMCALPPPEEVNALLRRAQRYTVNITESAARKLSEVGAIREICVSDDVGVWIAEESGYDTADLGLGADAGHLETSIF